MQECLRRTHPNRYTLPSVGDIKQLISSETQKSKGKKGKKRKRTDDLDDEQDKTSGCGPTIAQEYVDQLMTWIEEDPDAKPSALAQRLHAKLNSSSDYHH